MLCQFVTQLNSTDVEEVPTPCRFTSPLFWFHASSGDTSNQSKTWVRDFRWLLAQVITWGHVCCAEVVYGLEVSAQCYFVPEPVGSHKSATIPAVPFVWPPRSVCLGAAQKHKSLWDGAVPSSPWELHSYLGCSCCCSLALGVAATAFPRAIAASLSLLCLPTCTVLGALCARGCGKLTTE